MIIRAGATNKVRAKITVAIVLGTANELPPSQKRAARVETQYLDEFDEQCQAVGKCLRNHTSISDNICTFSGSFNSS
jgi:hypothetical protein